MNTTENVNEFGNANVMESASGSGSTALSNSWNDCAGPSRTPYHHVHNLVTSVSVEGGHHGGSVSASENERDDKCPSEEGHGGHNL